MMETESSYAASAALNKAVKLLDSKSEKVFYTGRTFGRNLYVSINKYLC